MPRVAGINVVGVAVAAVAFYAVGFLWYGVFFGELWMSFTGLTEDDAAGHMWKMALGPITPVVSAIAIAVVFKWKGGSFDVVRGALTAAALGIGFAIPVILYDYVYALEPVGLFLLDSSHLLVAYLVAGGVLGAFR